MSETQSISRAMFLLGTLRENVTQRSSFPRPPASFASTVPFSVTKTSRAVSSNISDSDPLGSLPKWPFWLLWAHDDNPGKRPFLMILNAFTYTKSFLPCKGTCSQVLGIRVWTSLGNHYFANHIIQPSNCTLGHLYQINKNLYPCKNLHMNDHRDFIHNKFKKQ